MAERNSCHCKLRNSLYRSTCIIDNVDSFLGVQSLFFFLSTVILISAMSRMVCSTRSMPFSTKQPTACREGVVQQRVRKFHFVSDFIK